MAACSSRNRLMEEINEQFLVCKICYEVYKQPKTLSCLHTFCADCLEKHQDAELDRSYRYMLYSRAISCPICRKKTEIPTGGVRRLPDNFLVANLSDVINRRRSKSVIPQCDICKPPTGRRVSNNAISKCLECCKFLCRSCVESHKRTKVTQSHGIFDIEVEKDIECKFHQDEVVRFYCEPCEICVCVLCTFQEHKGHNVSSFTEGIEKYRNSLDSLLMSCRGRISQLKEQLHIIDKCETDIKSTEEQIKDMAIESISVIRKKEKETVMDLYLTYGEDTIDFIKEKEFIQESIDSLQSTCNLTDLILKDKSIELLLLKKEIQEKLNLLLQRKWQHPPNSALQSIKFIPANPTFGYLSIDGSSHYDDNEEKHANEEQMRERVVKYEAISVNTQTELKRYHDTSTTMGVFIPEHTNEQITQTELIMRKEAGTLTSPGQGRPSTRTQCTLAVPDMRDDHTMTIGTPTMKRKIQTDSVCKADQETITSKFFLSSQSQSCNTQTNESCHKGTMTKMRRLNHQTTATDGLVITKDHETLTNQIMMCSTSTETIQNTYHSKATLTNRPYTSDKLTSTPRTILATQETNTPTVQKLDMGINAKLYGQDIGVSTRVIVTTNTATGDNDVTMQEKCVGMSFENAILDTTDKQAIQCLDQISMTDTPIVSDQCTYTNYFNMVDNSVGTIEKKYASVETCTPTIQLAEIPTITDSIDQEDKSVNVNTITEPEKVETLDEICQTMISLIDAMLWPSLLPVDQATNTESKECRDQGCGADPRLLTDCGTNTVYYSCDMGVGDSLCMTVDMGCNTIQSVSSVTDAGTGMDIMYSDKEIGTPSVSFTEMGVDTDMVVMKDATHEAFRGYLCDAYTNTDDVIVKPVVTLAEMSTNTITVQKTETGTCVTVSMKDGETEMAPKFYATGTTNTSQTSVDAHTTMGSNARVQDTYVCTTQIELATTACGTLPITTTETMMETEPPSVITSSTETDNQIMDTKATETIAIVSHDIGMVTKVDMRDTGADACSPDVKHQETYMEPISLSTIGIGTPTVLSQSKGTATDAKQTRNIGSCMYIQSVEKATYMPQTVTITTGTSTPQLLMSDKTSATDQIDLIDMGMNTRPLSVSHTETTMGSQVETSNRFTNTKTVTLVDSQSDPIPVPSETLGTNTNHVEYEHVETCTPEVITLNTGTTTKHRVHYIDQDMETMSMVTSEQETSTVPVEQHDMGNMTKPECRSVGLLKRPHTLSRGAGTRQIKLTNSSTSPHEPFTSEQTTMTASAETRECGTHVKPFGLISQSTATDTKHFIDTSTGMPQTTFTNRASSPISSKYTDRSCSPIMFAPVTCDRESSPIPIPTADKDTTVKPVTAEMDTATLHVDLTSKGTSMTEVMCVERSCSPILEFMDHTETVQRGTSMPHLVMMDEQTFAQPESINQAVGTTHREYTDRASTPIRNQTAEFGVNAIAQMESKEAGTPYVETTEMSTMIKKPYTKQSSTSMPHISFLEKETSTTHIHVMHKNTHTENMHMEDKQTNTVDITANYRELVAPSKTVCVTRGTSMGQSIMVSKETSPPRFDRSVDRASSPVKRLMVDKGVTAKSGQILEPVDKYHAAGRNSRPNKPITDRILPRLASIEEDGIAEEDESEGDGLAPLGHVAPKAHRLSYPPARPVMLSGHPRPPTGRLNHREKFWPTAPKMGKSAFSAFSVEGRSATSSIMCKVETGTNTRDITQQTKSTSTFTVDNADKATSTESMPVETKMAECINKLKTVRERLEVKQHGPYVQAPAQQEQAVTTPTDTAKPEQKPILSLNMRSKSVGEQLNVKECDVAPFLSPPEPRKLHDEEVSNDAQTPSAKRRAALARKQRLDINQLLRSSSLPERPNPPPPIALPKPKIQTVHPQYIPRLNIENYRSAPKNDQRTDTKTALLPDIKELSKEQKRDHSQEDKRPRPRPLLGNLSTPRPDTPPKVPPRRHITVGNDLMKMQKEKKQSEDKKASQHPPNVELPPPPPLRSTSLRHPLVIKNSDGKRKEGSPTKR